MRWWQFAFPSTSCARSSHHDNHRQKLSSRSVNSQQRRLTRVRKLRHLTDRDIGIVPEPSLSPDLWRFPSSADRLSPQRASLSSTAVPQPLPRPDLSFLLHRDTLSPSSTSSYSISASIPLPSPKDTSTSSRGGEERERADTSTGDGKADGVASSAGAGSRSACPNARKIAEHADSRSSGKAPQELKDGGRTGSYRFSMPISAPTSPFSSPALSPQRSNGDTHMSPYTSPQVFQVWSAPEMPPLDMALSPGCPYQMYSEISAYGVDNSPLYSPLTSPCRNTRSPTGSASPLNNRLSLEGQTSWRESNSQANVHPLPLPPAASPPLQPAISSQVTAKPELMPMNDKWQKGKLIGRGTFGSVYVATNRETGALCAMKEVEILPDDPKSAECMKQLEQEIIVLSHLKHPNIVQYYGSEIIGDKFYIYLEYVYPGSINKYIRDHCGAITESVVRNFTRHIVSGLAYLHSTKTIHRDIKGANLLVDASGVVKLADFGMAKHLAGQAADLSLKGSPHWMAPELLLSVMQKNASSDLALAVDIWSLGCTVIEMLNGKPPWSEYEGPAAMFKVLREHPPIPKTLSAEGKHFLRCCFRRNPADRPTANMLLEHQFLKNSQPLEVPHVTQALCGMTLMDKAHAPGEHYNYKHDQLSASPEAQATIGKPGNE